MADERKARLERLLERHGRTFADEMGIRLRGNPSDLFQLLVGALLMSARIGSDIAMSAARALFEGGMTTPEKMARASWQERVDALGEGSYVRYDESTASYLGATSELVLQEYRGDLRRLREAAQRDPDRERELLKEFKGIGDVGANIFFREAQAVWEELRPFADDAALGPARELDLASSVEELADLAGTDDLSRVTAALVRCDLAGDHVAIRTGQVDGEAVGGAAAELRRRTKDELYELARERELRGRSRMTKDELVDALASDG